MILGYAALIAASVSLLALGETAASAATGAAPQGGAGKTAVTVSYGKLPLIFEPNKGQTDGQVKFLSRGPGYTLFLTRTEAVLSLRGPKAKGDVLRVNMIGANPEPRVTGLGQLPGKSNYFIGKDRAKWRTNVPHFAKVRYESVYPAIDLVFYGSNQRRLEYDFVVAPGADPRAITLGFEGAARLEIDAKGDLVLHMAAGEVRFLKPVVYQEQDGARRIVPGHYTLQGGDRVGFEVAAYDADKPLIIDPVLAYSTFLGGEYSEYGRSVAVDADGNAYVTGYTRSLDFPVTQGAFQEWCAPSDDWEYCDTSYAFVSKLDATGTALVYSTYLGGSGSDYGLDIAVDSAGHAYVSGYTASFDFPTTLDALQTDCTSTVSDYGTSCGDAFIARLGVAGDELTYSTYFGGSGGEWAYSIALKPDCPSVDAQETMCPAYVAGSTSSDDLVTTATAFQTTLRGTSDAYVALVDPAGSGEADLLYSTYFGGSYQEVGFGIAVDPSGRAYVAGRTFSEDLPTTEGAFDRYCGDDADPDDCIPSPSIIPFYDAFVAKIDPADGNADPQDDLVYSTYLGGSERDAWRGADISVDAEGFAYVTGDTASSDFPTTIGAFQFVYNGANNAFVTKLAQDGGSLVYSTYLGGSEGSEKAYGIAVRPGCPEEPGAGCKAYVTGDTISPDFPTTGGAVQSTKGWYGDPFVTIVNSAGSDLLYSTYFGGATFKQNEDGSQSGVGEYGFGIAADAAGHAYVTGVTGSDDFPVTGGAFDTDCGVDGVPDDCTERSLSDAFVAKFEDLSASDPNLIHVGNIELVELLSEKGAWRALLAVTLHFSDETLAGEVYLTGEWRGNAGYEYAASCTMDPGSETCDVSSGEIPNKNDWVTFAVDAAELLDYGYDASANHAPDPDSNGTSITVLKPEKGGDGSDGGGGKPCNPKKEACS